MKISKRILGVALALIMIFNVFAVGTFAAFPADTAVKLMLSTDKTNYAPGDEIIITFSEQVIEEVGAMYIGGQYQIAYPTSVLDPYATTTTLEDHGFEALAAGYDDSISGLKLNAKIKDDIDEAGAANYGWDELIQYNVGDDSTENEATSAPLALFTVKMKIAADAPNGTYTIGYNMPAYENENAYVNDANNEGLYGTDASAWGFSVPNMYEYGTVTFTVGEPAPAYDLFHVENQYRPSEEVAGAYDLGVKFGFNSNIGIEFDEIGTSTNVARVGAEIYMDGVKIDEVFESDYVYEVGSDYQYRVIIKNLAKDSSNVFTVKPYLVYIDETVDVVYGEEITVKGVDVFPQ